jgi:hypothetical protein
VYDDVPLVAGNALLRTRAGLWTLSTSARMTSAPIWPGHYRPLLMATVWLQYQLAGATPWSWRLVNLLIHLGNGALVFALVRRLWRDPRAAAWAAALWLVHPIHAIAVDLVLKRNTSLCALLMLLALVAALRGSRRALMAAWLLGALALLVKEDAVALPLLVALALAADGQPLRRAWPFAVAPVLFALAALARLGAHGGALAYACAQPLALARYARMLVDPGAIAAGYDLEPGVTALRLVGVAACVLALAAAWAWRRRAPRLALAVGWAACALAPSSTIVPIAPAMDEVRAYVAFVFVLALAGAAVARARFGWALGVLALGLSARATFDAGERWRDPRALWGHAVARYPASKIANRGLCEAGGDPAVCARAVALWPDDAFCRYDLVAALAGAGRVDDAARAADAAALALPDAPMVWLAAGHLAWLRDDGAAAERAYRRVLAVEPGNDSARVHLADVVLARGRVDEAKALLAPLAAVAPAAAADAALLAELRARLAVR